MARKRDIRMPAPYLRRVWYDASKVEDASAYPYCLPLFKDGFEFDFDHAVTIIVGENGTGKSTLLEGIGSLAGYDDAGGGKGYRPVDHSHAIEVSGGALSSALRASWRPKLTSGWFFKAETFFSVARYLDSAGSAYADFLSHSHGEGFLRFFEERVGRQGIYILDEPESALSPSRQMEFLKILARADQSGVCQIIMATHSPILMAYPNCRLLQLTKYGLAPVSLQDTDHFRLMREFCTDPTAFVEGALEE